MCSKTQLDKIDNLLHPLRSNNIPRLAKLNNKDPAEQNILHIINIHQRRENETTLWQLSPEGYLEGVEHTPAECTRLRNIILDSKNGEPAELMPWKKFISLELIKYNVAYIDYNRALRDKIRQDWTLDYGQENDPVALEETRREFDAMFKRGHNHSGLDGDEEENEGSGDEGDGDQQAGVLDEDQRIPSQTPVIVGPSRGRGRDRGRGRGRGRR